MIKLLLFLSLSLSIINADTEGKINDYGLKGWYHYYYKKYKLSLGYRQKACELGSGIACSNVASMYNNALIDGIKNLTMAFKYYSFGVWYQISNY